MTRSIPIAMLLAMAAAFPLAAAGADAGTPQPKAVQFGV